MVLGEIKLTITVDLLQTDSQIQNEIYKVLAKEFNTILSRNKNKIIQPFRQAIQGWLLESPEINSLNSQGEVGSLNAVFGLSPGSGPSAVSAIISEVANSVEVNITKISPKDLSGGLEFRFQNKDFSNLLSLPQGRQVTELGSDLHWLDWLLTKGDAVIVKGFFYDPSDEGRSGGGTMKIGGTFRVPPVFSGTPDNNFITRAFVGRDAQISKILSLILK